MAELLSKGRQVTADPIGFPTRRTQHMMMLRFGHPGKVTIVFLWHVQVRALVRNSKEDAKLFQGLQVSTLLLLRKLKANYALISRDSPCSSCPLCN